MKRLSLFLSALGCLSLILSSGCENNTKTAKTESSQGENVQSIEHNVINSLSADAELVKTAQSFEELADASDFIAEVKITDTSSFVPEGTIKICTEMTPEIIKTYKGEYNGNSLIITGGYMNCREYAMSEEFFSMPKNPMDVSKFTEEELETGEIYFNWLNNYIPDPGDTLIFFGCEATDGNYYVTYDYQGIFLGENDTISNQALVMNDNSGYTEPLVKDLMQKFINSETTRLKSISDEPLTVLHISKNAFVDEIENLE